jgi:hypothetical protein
MPLPISAKFLKVAFGKSACQQGILIRNFHVRLRQALPDGSIIVESRVCPIEKGFLYGRFFIHLVYRIAPHPKYGPSKCVVYMHGQISVKCPPITGAVEKFTLPFSKAKQEAWRSLLQSYLTELASNTADNKRKSIAEEAANDIVAREV